MFDFLPFATALIYLGVAILYWRRSEITRFWPQVATSVALALHGWLLYRTLFLPEGMNLGLPNALSAIFWLTALIYWGTNLRHDLHRLQAFVLPPAALCVLLQWALPEHHVLTYADAPLFRLHLIIAFTAYSLLTFAALHALLMMAAERALHRKPSFIRLPDFPPLIGMEKLLFQIITSGFVLLTLTLASGILFSEQLFQQAFRLNHKTVFSFAAWILFGGLLLGRWKYGWRGRTAIRWTLVGFGLLLLAYVGSKFVLEFILHR
ncbi:MAG: cytochrome c biogenesis protein CcsA [Methylophilaceae bacterium]|nr:cytochrome c biogenesis protein CcsA [Methylophilaceae bacterium]